MAQQTGALPLPTGIPRSLSDRPLLYRWGVHAWRFVTKKPLGGIGVFVIIVVSIFAIFASQLQRYDPDKAFETDKPPCTEAQANENPPKTPCLDVKLKEFVDDNPILKISGEKVPELGRGVTDPNRLISGRRVLFTEPASSDHWLGTDLAGRDIYARVVHGTRLALIVGLGGSFVAVVLGTVLGLTSAYFGGLVDMLIQRIVDAFQAFPPFILLLLVTQVVDDPPTWFLAVALGMVGIATVTRVVRSAVLTTREDVYVMAARTIGASDPRIMARHILPNIFSPIIVVFTSAIGAYILAEAGLAFIGLGKLDAISWGKMIEEGRRLGPAKPAYAFFVGAALTVTVLGFNLAGDALRDVLDPRLRGRGGRPGF
jgi:peptide/nickel transport system permease protein